MQTRYLNTGKAAENLFTIGEGTCAAFEFQCRSASTSHRVAGRQPVPYSEAPSGDRIPRARFVSIPRSRIGCKNSPTSDRAASLGSQIGNRNSLFLRGTQTVNRLCPHVTGGASNTRLLSKSGRSRRNACALRQFASLRVFLVFFSEQPRGGLVLIQHRILRHTRRPAVQPGHQRPNQRYPLTSRRAPALHRLHPRAFPIPNFPLHLVQRSIPLSAEKLFLRSLVIILAKQLI